MKFLSSFFGHRGATASFPCVKCLIPKERLGTVCSEQRKFTRFLHGEKNNNSIFGPPLLFLSPSQIIPPSFHILQGLAQRVINAIEDYCQHSGRSIQKVFDEAHAKMDPRKKTFTGIFFNRKLILH